MHVLVKQNVFFALATTELGSDCPNKEVPKCSNCGGAHTASYGGCITIKEQKSIQKIKTITNVSYRDAIIQHNITKNTVNDQNLAQRSSEKALPNQQNIQQILSIKPKMTNSAVQTDKTTNLETQTSSCTQGNELKLAMCLLDILKGTVPKKSIFLAKKF